MPITIELSDRAAHDLQYLCGMVAMERTRERAKGDNTHPYPSVLNESLTEIRAELTRAWSAQFENR